MNAELRSEMINYLLAGAKPRADWRVGLELELIGYGAADSTAISQAERLNEEQLVAILGDYSASEIREAGTLVGARGPEGTLTLEPGGQLEYSGNPYGRLQDLEVALKGYLDWLSDRARERGAFFLATGFDPLRALDEQRWVMKPRYQIMRPYLGRRGARAWDMMTRTASVQTNIDFGSDSDLAQKFILGNRLAPVVTAIFANSPFREGRLAGFKSERAAAWLETDPDRCGIAPPALSDDFSVEDYVDWLAGVPMFFIRRQSEYIDLAGRPFADFAASNDGARPQDFIDHLTTVFTEARLKQWIELRSADAGDLKHSLAIAAFWKGLFYCPSILSEALRIAPRLDAAAFSALAQSVARDALSAQIEGVKVRELARDALALAMDGLRAIAPDETVYLEETAERVNREGIAPADILIRNFEGSWHGRIERAIEYLRIA